MSIHGLCGACHDELWPGSIYPDVVHFESEGHNVLIYPALFYLGMAQRFIIGMKYRRWFWVIPVLAKFMASRVESLDLSDFVVVSIPMHTRRIWHRGYNQAALLAYEVSKQLGLRYDGGILRRVGHAKIQQGLSKEEREKNIKGVFMVGVGCPEKILLIDDVLTTGSTVREACLALKQAGVDELVVVVGATADIMQKSKSVC